MPEGRPATDRRARVRVRVGVRVRRHPCHRPSGEAEGEGWDGDDIEGVVGEVSGELGLGEIERGVS